MDNKVSSVIKRGLKVTYSYFISLVVFAVLAFMVLGWGKESTPAIMPYFSFFIFLILFLSVYVEMRNVAIKEKRPQYNIKPSPLKGFLYGIIGSAPIIMVQASILIIKAPEGFEDFKRRVFQVFSGPFYWIAKLLGNSEILYMIAVLTVVFMAALGYIGGHYDFFPISYIKKKLGTKKIKRVN